MLGSGDDDLKKNFKEKPLCTAPLPAVQALGVRVSVSNPLQLTTKAGVSSVDLGVVGEQQSRGGGTSQKLHLSIGLFAKRSLFLR